MGDKLFAEYYKEREGLDTIFENGQGFATYRREPCGSFYIRDIYVRPEWRKSGLASKMADQVFKIAKENGAKFVYGSVFIKDPNRERNSKILMAYGFTPIIGATTDRLEWYIKEV